MRLLMTYVYTTGFEYGKFTISYYLKIPPGEGGRAISLNDDSGNLEIGYPTLRPS